MPFLVQQTVARQVRLDECIGKYTLWCMHYVILYGDLNTVIEILILFKLETQVPFLVQQTVARQVRLDECIGKYTLWCMHYVILYVEQS